jgi:hypothetical protein
VMITTLSPSAPSGVCACPPSSNLGALTPGRRPPGSSMQILPAPPRCLNRVPNRLICASSRPQLTQPSGAPSRRSARLVQSVTSRARSRTVAMVDRPGGSRPDPDAVVAVNRECARHLSGSSKLTGIGLRPDDVA